MKSYALLPLLVVCGTAFISAQDPPKPVHRTSFIESRQGNRPDGPDKIGHAAVLKDDTLMCMSVEVYDETNTAQTACVVRFKDGSKRVLSHGEFLKASADGDGSLECSGLVPRRCIIEVNDPVNQPPVQKAKR